MSLNGAIFDADGTLLASMHIWQELGARYLRSVNVEPEENLAAKLYPMSLEQSCAYVKRAYKLKFSELEIMRSILGIIEKFYVEEVALKPGVKVFLEALRAKNIPMVIATSGDRFLLSSALRRNEIDGYFSEIFTCTELNTTKHDTKIFLDCADFLGLKPENVGVFEDALFALRGAKSAGFVTFGVEDASNFYCREEIIDEEDYFIESFEEVREAEHAFRKEND